MGTSAGYQMPTGGEWTPLKTEATRFVQKDGDGNEDSSANPESVLANYCAALQSVPGFGSSRSSTGSNGGSTNGGSSGGSGGGSGSGGGGSGSSYGASSSAAIRISSGLGTFLSRVGTVGLGEALREAGLADMVGKTASEIARSLVETLAGPASTIDDYAAKKACDDLRKELLADAKTAEDVEAALKTTMDAQGLGGILMRYFSLYVFRRFCRDFYERWVAKVGSTKTGVKIAAIKKYVDTRLKARMVNKDITAVNWRGSDGERIVSQILNDTCRVFRIEGGKEGA